MPIDVLLVCRSFYEEGKVVFWRTNRFKLGTLSLNWLTAHRDYAKNVRHIIFQWKGMQSESGFFQDMVTFPKLKVLELNIVQHWTKPYMEFAVFEVESPVPVTSKKLSQDIIDMRRLTQTPGTEFLLQIRGLDKIQVDLIGDGYEYIRPGKVIEEVWNVKEGQLERTKAIEALLTSKVTLPRDEVRLSVPLVTPELTKTRPRHLLEDCPRCLETSASPEFPRLSLRREANWSEKNVKWSRRKVNWSRMKINCKARFSPREDQALCFASLSSALSNGVEFAS
jgi:hypothetical protein